jgi:hypothetical protein
MGFPEQFGLLAQGGLDDWANILFVAVLAILWLLGALVKAIGKKGAPREQAGQEDLSKERRRPGESWQERLVRKAKEMQHRLEEEAGLREPDEPPRPARPAARPSPQAPAGKITVRSGPKGGSVMVYEPPQSQPSAERQHQAARQRAAQEAVAAAGQYGARQASPVETPIRIGAPKREPVMDDLSGSVAEPPKPLEAGEASHTPTGEPAGFEVEALIDYSDPDALKKAVLHYEILGRPLALRDTSDHTSPF